MMKNKILLPLAIAALMLNSALSLGEGAKKKPYKVPYGMAGCGFGAMVIDKNEMLPQIGSWFLNSIYSNQTYGISSGTTNCVEGNSLAQMEKEVYLKANYASLSREAAQGQGDHLVGLAEIMGCPTEQINAFSGLSKSRFQSIFAEDSVEKTLSNFERELKDHKVLSKACIRLS